MVAAYPMSNSNLTRSPGASIFAYPYTSANHHDYFTGIIFSMVYYITSHYSQTYDLWYCLINIYKFYDGGNNYLYIGTATKYGTAYDNGTKDSNMLTPAALYGFNL